MELIRLGTEKRNKKKFFLNRTKIREDQMDAYMLYGLEEEDIPT